MRVEVDGVLETCLYCDDVDEAERFYRDVLGLRFYSRQEGRHVFFRCGRGMLLIFNPAATSGQSIRVGGAVVPPHGAEGPGHVAFRVDAAAIDEWRQRLSAAGVAIESEVAWPGGGRSLYFRDPSGNSLELAVSDLWDS